MGNLEKLYFSSKIDFYFQKSWKIKKIVIYGLWRVVTRLKSLLFDRLHQNTTIKNKNFLRKLAEKFFWRQKHYIIRQVIRYRSELANSSQSCFRATISRPRNKHPLVFNFRLTRIDIVSILLVIIKIRNKNKISF